MLVSIIITSYNYEKYIEECITSCIFQKGFSDFEVIVVNDGSLDSTQSILEKYLSHPKVRVFNNQNHGIEYSSNFGIKKSLGKYIVRVDADDVLEENFLSKMVELIKKDNTAFVYSDYIVIDEQSKYIKNTVLPVFKKDEILARGDFLATGTLYEKKVLENIGLYNEETVNCGLESYELIVKLLNENHMGVHLNEPLFYYRRHTKNMSEVKQNSIIGYGKELFKKLKMGEYKTNEFHPYGLVIDD